MGCIKKFKEFKTKYLEVEQQKTSVDKNRLEEPNLALKSMAMLIIWMIQPYRMPTCLLLFS